MARIIGGFGTSHIPAIGKAIAQNLQKEPYWKPFFEGYRPVHEWLAREKPDVVVSFYNDHGLNFFLDKMPTFAIGAADEYRNADEGWGIPVIKPFKGDARFSWHLVEGLIAANFDMTTCQEMLVDHAFAIPMALLWPGPQPWPVTVVPVAINTVQFPLPSAERCFRLGQAVAHAIESYGKDLKVLVLGTGGLSHQLDGQRAGFINKTFDQHCLDKIVNDPEELFQYSPTKLVELAGSQGVELLNWMAMRGALAGRVKTVHSNYHIPISNTASAVLLLETQHAQQRLAKSA